MSRDLTLFYVMEGFRFCQRIISIHSHPYKNDPSALRSLLFLLTHGEIVAHKIFVNFSYDYNILYHVTKVKAT